MPLDQRERQRIRELDSQLGQLCRAFRLLAGVTPRNAPQERRRLMEEARRGGDLIPRWEWRQDYLGPKHWWALDRSRKLASHTPVADLYERRIDELELEMMLIERIGQTSEVRGLAKRRFGDGQELVPVGEGDEQRLDAVAVHLLNELKGEPEPRTIPAEAAAAREGVSAAEIMREVLRASGVPGQVRVDDRLAAGAATGDRLVFLANRKFGHREIARFAIHEVLGHLTAAANGRSQPLGIFEFGTGGSFGDQEGVALYLEELAGLLDAERLRTLAARVLISRWMHEGASFHDSVHALMDDHGFVAEEAVVLGERAYRGGGVARDVCYLRGWLRVRSVCERDSEALDRLRIGRVGVHDLPRIDELIREGDAREPVYVPSLAASLEATALGTRAEISPPSRLTSLMRFEAT